MTTTTPLPIPNHRRARLTRHAAERLLDRDIAPEEISTMLASAWRMVDAIDLHAAERVRVHHLGITVILARGRVVVSAWRGR